ncbi:MAG: hypothetical protein JEZ09_08350 [Salinivirgaceae bacterium]|nr:hypothetical protein [Salinivirgaceae bacterium]
MKKLIVLLLVIFAAIVGLNAQSTKNEIRIKITQNNKLLLDTTFVDEGESAAKSIQQIVGDYSKEPVYVDGNNIHGLYVFDISCEFEEKTYVKEVVVNLDSILEQFGEKLETKWDNWEMDGVIDTLHNRYNDLKKEIKEFDAETDPDFQEFKKDMHN